MSELGDSPFREGGSFRVCLIYPNTRAVGACNLGYATLFRMLNAVEGCSAERLFALNSSRKVVEKPCSLETGRPVQDFAALAFSCMCELDYLHVMSFLTNAGIPWRNTERAEDAPLIIVGGAAPTLNPAPMSALADVIVQGEWETDGDALAALMVAGCEQGGRLGIPAALQAGHEHRLIGTCVVITTNPAQSPMAHLDLIPTDGVFAKLALVEVTRGCPWTCRFCSARSIYRPYRQAPVEAILDYAERVRPLTERIGLVGAGLAAHPDLVSLLDMLAERGFTASPASLRLDAMKGSLLKALREHGLRTITLAPETFRPATWELLGKNPPPGGLLPRLQQVLSAGFSRLKLYMMLGIPGDDLDESVECARDVLRALGRQARRLELSYAVFQPKPSTAMAHAELASLPQLKKEIKAIRKGIGPLVGSLELPGPKRVLIADLLSRGGTDALELAAASKPRPDVVARSIEQGKRHWLTNGGSIPFSNPPKD